MSQRIGFIGAGQMARALAKGWVAAGVVERSAIVASDADKAARRDFADQTGAAVTSDNKEVVQKSDVLVLAVKPQVMDAVLAELKTEVADRHLVISIAAGVAIRKLSDALGAKRRLIRVMPNTPCLVQASASGFAVGGGATDEDAAFAAKLMSAVGVAVRVPEAHLDAVTGLSGSGPAYVYLMIEALSDGGVKAGLPRDVATKLAAQTVLGSARMVLETGLHPGQLKDMVTSPAGTTIAGLSVLEQRGVRSAFLDAVVAATDRARELGK